MAISSLREAREFLAARRIAVVGVSRHEKDFSRHLFRELARRGLDVVAVNPGLEADVVDGRRAFARIEEVAPAPDAALLLVPAASAANAVRGCLAAGVKRVWFHSGAGPGSASPEAVALCREAGVTVVAGLCPFMALPRSGFPHRLHGFFRRALARG